MKLNSRHIERNLENIKVYSYNCVESTNKIAKKLAAHGASEGTTVIAAKQTAGRGRLGRSFISPKGGVYFTVVLKPATTADTALFITVAAAVAAARAIETVSDKKCEIKWVNDIYVNNKKVCGILAEGSNDCVVLGVGINLFAPKGGFPGNLPLADSVFNKNSKIFGKKRTKERIVTAFLTEFFSFYKNLQKKAFVKEYQSRSLLTGKEIKYTKNSKTYNAVVEGIDDNARLIVNCNDKIEFLSHGEIQIIGMEQLLV